MIRHVRHYWEAFVTSSKQRLALVMVGALVLVAVPASAQELSVGYQWQRFALSTNGSGDFGDFGDFDESLTAPFGVNVDLAIPIPGNLDVIGQLDWSHWSESADIFGASISASANFTTFAGGIRWSSLASPRVTPYVQGLFGATRLTFGCDVTGFDCQGELEDVLGQDTSATDMMFQFGGGVAIPLGGWSVVGQLDYRRFFAEDESVSSIRFVAGIRLGTR